MTAEDWRQIKSNMIADEVAGYADLTDDTGGSHEGETAGGEANESKSDDDEDDSAGREDGEEIEEEEDGDSDFEDRPSSKRRVPNSR
jgi:hypothetical protein